MQRRVLVIDDDAYSGLTRNRRISEADQEAPQPRIRRHLVHVTGGEHG
jgi:hypothetical protein